MKTYFNCITCLFILAIIFVSCNKEVTSKSLNPFFKVTVNGSKKSVPACGTSDHVVQYLSDTVVFTAFGCDGLRVGFYIKGRITDGTYHLDHLNKAWYDENTMRYSTDSLHQGTLTIRTVYFQAPGGIIPCVEGEISFDAIDKSSGRTIKVTNGKYLLKKYQY